MQRLLPKDQRERYVKEIPMQRLGTVDDIANCVLYLVSDAATYVTGISKHMFPPLHTQKSLIQKPVGIRRHLRG